MTPMASEVSTRFDVSAVRSQFPILSREVNGHRVVYLDSAASSQRPERVIEAVSRCYREYYANVHRGVHTFSQQSTDAYEGARERIGEFIGAPSDREVIFTRGTTEAINLVAQSFARPRLKPGDEILVSEMEHHSNIVPWQLVCEQTGAKIVVAPFDDDGNLLLDEMSRLLTDRTLLLAVTHVSNALGTLNPLDEIVAMARDRGVAVLVDGAQAVPHLPVNVADLGCDFYAFSSHKMYGPSGIGALWGRAELLDAMPPYQGGGEMILSVSFDHTEFNELPHKFEAGTPAIAQAIGFGEAVDFLSELGMKNVQTYEDALVERAAQALSDLPGVELVGRPKQRVGVVSFTMEGIHPHDIGTILDDRGIAVRTGHHCAQPVMAHFGLPATARASFSLYNNEDDLARLVEGLRAVQDVFGSPIS